MFCSSIALHLDLLGHHIQPTLKHKSSFPSSALQNSFSGEITDKPRKEFEAATTDRLVMAQRIIKDNVVLETNRMATVLFS